MGSLVRVPRAAVPVLSEAGLTGHPPPPINCSAAWRRRVGPGGAGKVSLLPGLNRTLMKTGKCSLQGVRAALGGNQAPCHLCPPGAGRVRFGPKAGLGLLVLCALWLGIHALSMFPLMCQMGLNKAAKHPQLPGAHRFLIPQGSPECAVRCPVRVLERRGGGT